MIFKHLGLLNYKVFSNLGGRQIDDIQAYSDGPYLHTQVISVLKTIRNILGKYWV